MKFIKAIQNIPSLAISFLIVFFNMREFSCRGLTSNEITLAQSVFGHLINYHAIKIFNIPYLPWQPINIFIAPNGHLFVHQQYFCLDYSKGSMDLQGIFIHELAHILQFQQGTHVILKGMFLQIGYYLSFKKYNPYKYTFIQGKNFRNYNIEQQGDIARDIFLKKIPNIILNP